MKSEIDNDFYCAADMYKDGYCDLYDEDCEGYGSCKHCHRKHPTPEQFREEYGEEYPDDGAVYLLCEDSSIKDWTVQTYAKAEEACYKKKFIVCASTPFGNPARDWRPL